MKPNKKIPYKYRMKLKKINRKLDHLNCLIFKLHADINQMIYLKEKLTEPEDDLDNLNEGMCADKENKGVNSLLDENENE
jgi:hypothetical protein